MANEMLKFKKGLYSKLKDQPISVGTVYVTTDEKAMYVDIINSESQKERIRIGDFIRVNTVQDITPPYSTSSLYYVEADNALLKYVVKDGETTGEWKQVNGTDAIKESIEGLEELIGDNADAIAEISGIVGKEAEGEAPATGLVKKVADNTAAIAKNVQDIAKNAGDIKNIQDAIGLGEGEGVITERLDSLEEFQEAAQNSINEHTNKISALETASAKHAEKSYVDETFATKANTYTKDDVYTKAEVDAAIDADVAAEAKLRSDADDALSGRINTAQAAAEAAQSTADSKVTMAQVEAKDYATKEHVESELDAAVAAEVLRADGKYATKTELAGTEGRVTLAQNKADDAYALAETKTTMADVEKKGYATVTKAEELATEAKNAAIEDAAKKYATTGDREALQGGINDAKDAAAAAKQAADKAQADATQAIGDAAAAQATANSGVSKAEAAQKDATQALADAAKAQGAAEGAQSAADAAQGAAEAADGKAVAAGQAAAAAQGDATKALADAATADGKAVAAQQKADSAYNLADTANKAAAGAQKTADENADAIEEIKTNYATKEEVEQVEEDLTAKIDADIKAVNAMTYKGTVDGVQSVLPTSGVKIGDTYAVSTGFTGEFGPVKPGDLLIATDAENTEGENGEITGTVKWHVVYTGYSDALDPALDAIDNQIKLSSLGGVNGDLGIVKFVAEGAASVRTVAATETAPAQIFVGTVWEDF